MFRDLRSGRVVQCFDSEDALDAEFPPTEGGDVVAEEAVLVERKRDDLKENFRAATRAVGELEGALFGDRSEALGEDRLPHGAIGRTAVGAVPHGDTGANRLQFSSIRRGERDEQAVEEGTGREDVAPDRCRGRRQA